MNDIIDEPIDSRAGKSIILPLLRTSLCLYFVSALGIRFYAAFTGLSSSNYFGFAVASILYATGIYYNASMAENEYYNQTKHRLSVPTRLGSMLIVGYLLFFVNLRSIYRLMQVDEYRLSMILAGIIILISFVIIVVDLFYLINGKFRS